MEESRFEQLKALFKPATMEKIEKLGEKLPPYFGKHHPMVDLEGIRNVPDLFNPENRGFVTHNNPLGIPGIDDL